MADTNSTVLLKNIVAETLALSGSPKSKYYVFFQTATNIVRDLNLFHLRNSKRVLVDMDGNNTISFPSDYLGLISLGVPINGKLWVFGKDNDLLAIATTDPVYSWEDAIDEKSTVSFGARGGKNQWYFKIDEENKRFVFNGAERSEVILEYVSSGLDATAATSIPLIAKQSVVSYILWRDALMNEKTYYNRTELLRVDHEREIEKLRMLQLPSIDEIRDEVRKSYRQSPKR